MIVRSWGRAVARRAAGPVLHRLAHLAGGPPPGLRRGTEHEPADVPVLAVVLVGATAASVDAVLAAVVRAQREHEPFTPVFLVDEPLLAPFRRAGYVVELVGPAGLAEAVREVRLSYSAAAVVAVDGASPQAAQRLPDLLAGLHPGPPAGRLARGRALLRRVEARLR